MPAAVSAGVTLTATKNTKNRVVTTTGTSDDARTVNRLHNTHNNGPCLAAAGGDELVSITDFSTEIRWPRLCADVSATTAIRSSVSYRLHTSDAELGALTVYADRPAAFSPSDVEIGYSVATYSAFVLDAARRGEQFVAALASRDIIGQAKGMIMERFDVGALRAFELLKQLSQDGNTLLVEVARQPVAAEKPGPLT